MRCPDCSKFVPFDTEAEPEENNELTAEQKEDQLIIEGDYRRLLPCAECGTELKSAEIQVSTAVDLAALAPCTSEDGEHEWELEESSVEPTTEFEGKGRGQRTYYGVEVTGSFQCAHCKQAVSFEMREREQASSFDEC